MFYIIIGLIVPEEECEAFAWTLMKRNFALKLGQWFIDPDTRILTLRTTQFMTAGEDTVDRMYDIISECGILADEFYPELAPLKMQNPAKDQED